MTDDRFTFGLFVALPVEHEKVLNTPRSNEATPAGDQAAGRPPDEQQRDQASAKGVWGGVAAAVVVSLFCYVVLGMMLPRTAAGASFKMVGAIAIGVMLLRLAKADSRAASRRIRAEVVWVVLLLVDGGLGIAVAVKINVSQPQNVPEQTQEQVNLERAQQILAAPGVPDVSPPPAPGSPVAALDAAMGGNPEWSDQRIPLERRTQNFLQTHAMRGTTDWGAIAAEAQRHFPGVDLSSFRRGYETESGLAQARQRFSQWTPTISEELVLNNLPFVGYIGQLGMAQEHADATQRLRAGNPTPNDFTVIARHERLQEMKLASGLTR